LVEIKVELYKPPVSNVFRHLPGYDSARRHVFSDGEFWAVVTPKPPPRSLQAKWIAPVPPDANFSIPTMGTEPLPFKMDDFLVSTICVKGYKYNPYLYKITAPSSQLVGSIPEARVVDESEPFFCRCFESSISGIGIWLVRLVRDRAIAFPEAPLGREAVFEPANNAPGVQHSARQPYMILSDDPHPKYVAYYNCSGWSSVVEVMNLQGWTAEFTVVLYSRTGFPLVRKTIKVKPHETKRLKLDSINPHYDGLIVIQPVKQGLEFPSTLILRKNRSYQFVPFIRVP
jgi:hypothetical protein